jgi:membrane associated rhomboid family serine protease
MEVCYRHPNRETGVRCSNCERPICPDCMTSTPVGMRCPECARQRTRVQRGVRSSSDEPTLTYILIGINVLIGLGLLFGGSSGGEFGHNQLYDYGALARFEIADGEYWRLVTSGFIHGSGDAGSVPLHLMFNMLSLWILGSILEPAVGRLRFGLIYFVSLLSGSFGALMLEPDALTAGASGAVFGLMGAAVVVMRNRGMNIMESGLGLWLGLNLLITFTWPGISIGGHLGGLVGGALTALVLYELPGRVRIPETAANVICGAIGVVAVAGSIAVSGSAG